jgi:predicted protein tyrosine phosphatase
MIRIHVYSEREVTRQNFFDHLVISIVSPGREHLPEIIGSNIHRFKFHDISQEYFLENQNKIIRPMEKEIAESIAEIAMDNRDNDRWIIHCEAGISRSPGVAIGLAKYIALKPHRLQLIEKFPLYNKYVCKLIEDAMEKEIEKLDIKLRKLLSPGPIDGE